MYKIYLEGQPRSKFETIEATDFFVQDGSYIFTITLVGHSAKSVAAYRAKDVVKIEYSSNASREQKLKRLLKKDSKFKKWVRKIFDL